MSDILHNSPLGKTSVYSSEYDPSILFAIDRQPKRDELGIHNNKLPFYGRDLWYAYEMSWLTPSGKPAVRVVQFDIPCDSPCVVESKSFKLYLNSFNQTRFDSIHDVEQALLCDLSNAVRAQVKVKLMTVDDFQERNVDNVPGVNIDDLDIAVDCYEYDPNLLADNSADLVVNTTNVVSETLNTHLLKSNCPVTGQPDWATLVISYRGSAMDRKALLKYVCSFRSHCGFHEQCVEQVFMDLQKHYQPEILTVYAQYLRRGGLDINPWRSTLDVNPEALRFIRQ